MSLKIGMILDAFYPADIRVYKEASALIKGGFEIHLLCKRRSGEPDTEEIDGIKVHRINAGKSNFSKGIVDIITAIQFVNPWFRKAIPKFVKENNITVLHVHDLPLFKTTFLYKKSLGLTIVCDFHENYPDALAVWFTWKKNPVIKLKNKLFFSFHRWLKYEAFAASHADYLIAVVDEMKERLTRYDQVTQSKITVITNTEETKFVSNEIDPEIYGKDNDFIVTYTGNVGPHRGVDTAIEGIKYLKNLPDIKLYIVGSGSPSVMQRLNNIIKSETLDKQVRLTGYQPFSKFYSYMKMADVNIIPHHSNGHTDNTVPHKLFQAMMTGKPVLVSSCAPLKRLITETGSGVFFEAGNAIDFARKLRSLYDNRSWSEKLGQNGRRATLEGTYNWESTAKLLVQFYQKVEIKHRQSKEKTII